MDRIKVMAKIEERYWRDRKPLPLKLWLLLWDIDARTEGNWDTSF